MDEQQTDGNIDEFWKPKGEDYLSKLNTAEQKKVTEKMDAEISNIVNEFQDNIVTNEEVRDQIHNFFMDEASEIDRDRIDELLRYEDVNIEEAMEVVFPNMNITTLINDILANRDVYKDDAKAAALVNVFEKEKEKFINKKINEIAKSIFENREEAEATEVPEMRSYYFNATIEDIYSNFNTVLNLYNTDDYEQQVGKLGITYADNPILLKKLKEVNRVRKKRNKKLVPFILPIIEDEEAF